jgi:putative DNA primase/helicase
MRWDGTRWGFDETMLAFSLSRKIIRDVVACTGKGSCKAQTVAAIERLAKADRVLAATVDQWDMAPLKFNEGD